MLSSSQFPSREPKETSVRTTEELIKFLNSLNYREHFIVELADSYKRTGRTGEEYIVWYEGTISSDQTTFTFFYDDGIVPADAWFSDLEDPDNDYPHIECTVADIVSVRRI